MIAQSKAMLTALAQHKERRRKETQKAPVAPDYPDWRVEELARKYSEDEPREPHRGFYDPYG